MSDKDRTARRHYYYSDTPRQKTLLDELAKKKGYKDAGEWSKILLFKYLNNYENGFLETYFDGEGEKQ